MQRRIFVFDTDIAGLHITHAADYACRYYSAKTGDFLGFTGREAYAIPVCEQLHPRKAATPLSIARIASYVRQFQMDALAHRECDFLVPMFSFYQPGQIADLFTGMPDNVYLQARLAYGLK